MAERTTKNDNTLAADSLLNMTLKKSAAIVSLKFSTLVPIMMFAGTAVMNAIFTIKSMIKLTD
jgi:hypothetical protein